MMLIVASIGVALVAFILYALERRGKNESIVWEDAFKLSLFGGLVTAGVVFASTAETVQEVVGAVEVPNLQEMFVGTPTF
jgi:hypothetical protein